MRCKCCSLTLPGFVVKQGGRYQYFNVNFGFNKYNFQPMRRKVLLTLMILGLAGIYTNCSAIKVPGYIVDQNQDTLYGTVILSKVDQITGDLIIGGFDQASLYSSVTFKGTDEKSFHKYSPDLIKGFGFGYDTTTFVFRTFLVKFNSLFPEGQEKNCFLNLIYQGSLELYQYIACIKDPSPSTIKNGYKTYREYYLYAGSKDLFRVAASDRTKSVNELLRQAGVEEQFLGKIPENSGFEDIKRILVKYDQWLAMQPQ
jgi:hypothetical protein